jgi:hypothetical protein
VGVGIGAAGLVGVVVGSIFGIKAVNKNVSPRPCPSGPPPPVRVS